MTKSETFNIRMNIICCLIAFTGGAVFGIGITGHWYGIFIGFFTFLLAMSDNHSLETSK